MPNRKHKRFKKGDVVTPAYGQPYSGKLLGVVTTVGPVLQFSRQTSREPLYVHMVRVHWRFDSGINTIGVKIDTNYFFLYKPKELRLASEDETIMCALAGRLGSGG